MRVSLVVPTFNRAAYLAKALPSFAEQTLDRSRYEVIVVDNNSSDDTRLVAERFVADAPDARRYVHEPRQGLHHARNRGIHEARGDVVVFGDDDIIADRGWLEALLAVFDGDLGVGVVGGRVVPRWDAPPPEWIYDYGDEKTHMVFAYLDYGPVQRVLTHELLFGCNFAMRRELCFRVGGSFPDTFPRELRRFSGTGESAMIGRARTLGARVVYEPRALVEHHADSSRATLSYFIERHRRWAIEHVFEELRAQGRLLGTVRVVRNAAHRLRTLPRRCRNKREPTYAAAIECATCYETFAQLTRVLTSDSLYRHIVQDGYL